jgi:hypothetical protein
MAEEHPCLAKVKAEIEEERKDAIEAFGKKVAEDVLRQMASPGPMGAAVAAIKAEKPLLAARLRKAKAAKEAEAVAKKERQRQQEQDDYDAGNNRRAAILAVKRKREKNG